MPLFLPLCAAEVGVTETLGSSSKDCDGMTAGVIVTVGVDNADGVGVDAGIAEIPGGKDILSFIPDFSKIVVFGGVRPDPGDIMLSSSAFSTGFRLLRKTSSASLVGEP